MATENRPDVTLDADGTGHRLTFTIRFGKPVADWRPYVQAVLRALHESHEAVGHEPA